MLNDRENQVERCRDSMGFLSLRFLTKMSSIPVIFRFNSPTSLKISKLCGIVYVFFYLSLKKHILLLLPRMLHFDNCIPQKPENFIRSAKGDVHSKCSSHVSASLYAKAGRLAGIPLTPPHIRLWRKSFLPFHGAHSGAAEG